MIGWCPTPPRPGRTETPRSRRGLGGLARSRRVGGLALDGLRGAVGLARFAGFAFEDAEDRLHLGVAQGRVAPRAPGRREQGTQVRLGHLGARLELLHLDREPLRPAVGLLPGLPRLASLLTRRPQRAAQGSHLAPELDRALDDLAPDLGVGRAAALLLPARPRLAPGRPAGPRDLLAFARLDRGHVQQAVPAVDGLEPSPREQGADRPRGRERLDHADLLAELGRREVDELARRRPGRDGGEERVGPLEALLVHAGHRVGFRVGSPPPAAGWAHGPNRSLDHEPGTHRQRVTKPDGRFDRRTTAGVQIPRCRWSLRAPAVPLVWPPSRGAPCHPKTMSRPDSRSPGSESRTSPGCWRVLWRRCCSATSARTWSRSSAP